MSVAAHLKPSSGLFAGYAVVVSVDIVSCFVAGGGAASETLASLGQGISCPGWQDRRHMGSVPPASKQ